MAQGMDIQFRRHIRITSCHTMTDLNILISFPNGVLMVLFNTTLIIHFLQTLVMNQKY